MTEVERIGMDGEMVSGVRHVVRVDENGPSAFGWRRVGGTVEFEIIGAMLDQWDQDKRFQFVGSQLSLSREQRSHLGRRALTAISMLDNGFTAIEPETKVASYAISVEALLSREPDESPGGYGAGAASGIARRVAYLTCTAGCGKTVSPCFYVRRQMGEKLLLENIRQARQKGSHGLCTAYLNIQSSKSITGLPTALFIARNQVAHEGWTGLDQSAIRSLRVIADETILTSLAWCADNPDLKIADLDSEIDEAVARFPN